MHHIKVADKNAVSILTENFLFAAPNLLRKQTHITHGQTQQCLLQKQLS